MVYPSAVGTFTGPGPVETVRVTREPVSTLVPPTGFSPITVCAGWECVTKIVSTLKFLFNSTVRAVFNCSPTTGGTTTCLGRVKRKAAAPAARSSANRRATHGHGFRRRGSEGGPGGGGVATNDDSVDGGGAGTIAAAAAGGGGGSPTTAPAPTTMGIDAVRWPVCPAR